MRRALFATVVVLAVVVMPSATAVSHYSGPPPVCQGLTICSPVGGPWVVVPGPAGGARVSGTVWRLGCPNGVVGGLAAHVSKPWIEVTFPGRLGSPVNPGITTGSNVDFTVTSVGPSGVAASFIPVVGCIPSPGGKRVPSGVRASHAAGLGVPITRRMRVLEVWPGRRARTTFACQPGERLASVETAIGLYTARRPTAAQLRAVRVTRSAHGDTVVVTAVRQGLARTVAADVQIHGLCVRHQP
ncbi:MAG: hypothetical protein QOD52_372 [Gaiellaceae bacterium]|nr:hypothetical protein [Gaiellaceae bacterium]